MSESDILIFGSGGQGILFTGTILAQGAVYEKKETTWFPSYGAAQRGGISHCTVVISEKKILSPIVSFPQAVIAMDNVGFDIYAKRVKKGGLLFVNTSIVNKKVDSNNVEVIEIPASRLAQEIGDIQVANIIMLGSYIKKSKVLKIDTISSILKEKSSLSLNITAFEKGLSLI